MSKQIRIRIPNHLVGFLDELVADGRVKWRSHAVAQAVSDYERHLSADGGTETQVTDQSRGRQPS